MTFDNSKTIIKLRLRLFIATLVMLVYFYVVYFGKQLRFPVFGIEEFGATLTLITIYVLIAFLPLLLRYKYIYYSDDGNSIILRYYSVGLFSGKKNSVEIPKKNFTGYKTKRHFPGLIISLQLFCFLGNKKAGYPPIYISSLSKPEREKIMNSLNTYIQNE